MCVHVHMCVCMCVDCEWCVFNESSEGKEAPGCTCPSSTYLCPWGGRAPGGGASDHWRLRGAPESFQGPPGGGWEASGGQEEGQEATTKTQFQVSWETEAGKKLHTGALEYTSYKWIIWGCGLKAVVVAWCLKTGLQFIVSVVLQPKLIYFQWARRWRWNRKNLI